MFQVARSCTHFRVTQICPYFLQAAIQKRHLWRWVDAVANRPDMSRIQEVGADRACAEWLLRCGAFVKWEGTEYWFKDYNALPTMQKGKGQLRIAEVDCDEAGIMDIGFVHFANVKHLKKIRFNHCPYLEDSALKGLERLKDSLEHLIITSCGDVTDRGLLSLTSLSILKTLHLRDLPEVQQKQKCYDHLKKALPACDINYEDLHKHDNEGTEKGGGG